MYRKAKAWNKWKQNHEDNGFNMTHISFQSWNRSWISARLVSHLHPVCMLCCSGSSLRKLVFCYCKAKMSINWLSEWACIKSCLKSASTQSLVQISNIKTKNLSNFIKRCNLIKLMKKAMKDSFLGREFRGHEPLQTGRGLEELNIYMTH